MVEVAVIVQWANNAGGCKRENGLDCANDRYVGIVGM